MTYDFEGKTEKEAIERAMQELGLERSTFDVEILEEQRGGFFKKGYVKIRLHTDEGHVAHTRKRGRDKGSQANSGALEDKFSDSNSGFAEETPPDGEFEAKIVEFVKTVLEKMGMPGAAAVTRRERRKLVLDIQTTDSAIIIGRKGRTLDSLQLIATLYAKKIHRGEVRIVLDCEQYRMHHEDSLTRLAYSVADRVRARRRSILLEPMNPYDRRLIHTALDKEPDIETKSEGEGTYKQVRIIYHSPRNR